MTDTTNYNYCYDVPDPKHVELTSDTSYNQKGLPTPPAGWGKTIGFVDSVDGDDEGPESRDTF